MFSPSIVGAFLVALVGWYATIHLLKQSKLSQRTKKWLTIPMWVPWLCLALLTPVATGELPFANALTFGVAMVMGMFGSVLFANRAQTKNSQSKN
jgi:hypothetical protein